MNNINNDDENNNENKLSSEYDFLITYVDEDEENYNSITNNQNNLLKFENKWTKRLTSWFKEKFSCISSDKLSINHRLQKIHILLNIIEPFEENQYTFPLLNNYQLQTQKKNKRKKGSPLTIVYAIKYKNKFIMVETSIENDWRIIKLINNQVQIAKLRKNYSNNCNLDWKYLYCINPYQPQHTVKDILGQIKREFR